MATTAKEPTSKKPVRIGKLVVPAGNVCALEDGSEGKGCTVHLASGMSVWQDVTVPEACKAVGWPVPADED